jgi:hypothetical protein
MKTIYQEERTGPTYERPSYMHGGGWVSYERNVVPGTVRSINKILSRAWTVEPRLFRPARIHWIAVDPDQLRKVDINEKP